MNSVERRFGKIAEENPHWAPYVCLAGAVAGRKYNHKTIRRNFLKLAPKEDYEIEAEKDLIEYLGSLSNT